MLDRIFEDLKKAQLSRDGLTVSVLRLLISEIKNTSIAKGKDLSYSEIISVVQRETKKRHEASDGFKRGARPELAQKEEKEAQILQAYLPEQLSNEELTKIVEETILKLDAKSLSDMGRVIGGVMAQVGQKADGSRVSGIVKERLR